MTGGENNTPIDCILWTDDVTIMTSSSKKSFCMFKIKFPTKRIFRIFYILRINGMAPFCNLFMERPSYFLCRPDAAVIIDDIRLHRAWCAQLCPCIWNLLEMACPLEYDDIYDMHHRHVCIWFAGCYLPVWFDRHGQIETVFWHPNLSRSCTVLLGLFWDRIGYDVLALITTVVQ